MEKPFLTFRENFKKDMKRFDHHIADLRKQLVGRYAAVEKVHTNTLRYKDKRSSSNVTQICPCAQQQQGFRNHLAGD